MLFIGEKMVHCIYITHHNGLAGYLGIACGQFVSNAPNRNCVVWLDSLKKVKRVIEKIKKRWDMDNIEIKTHEKILR